MKLPRFGVRQNAAEETFLEGGVSGWLPYVLGALLALVLFAAQHTYREIDDTREDAEQLAASLIDSNASAERIQDTLVGLIVRNDLVVGARYCRGSHCISVPEGKTPACAESGASLTAVCASAGQPPESIELHYSLRRAYRDAAISITILLIIFAVTGTVVHLSTARLRRRMHCAKQELVIAATRDAMSGLLNRSAFEAHYARALDARPPHAAKLAMLFIDLADFKAINDIHGHAAGDVVLKEVAQRIVRAVGETGIAGRLGGDEFAVLLLVPKRDAERIGEKVLQALAIPANVQGQLFPLGTTIGAVEVPVTTGGCSEALRRASVALQAAKHKARGQVVWYQPSMDEAIQQRYSLQSELRAAIEGNQLLLHYQPQVGMDGNLSGVEALVRWKHPTRGMVRPDQFIGLAEQSGLIGALGMKVFEMACADLVHCRELSIQLPYISVNVSTLQLAVPSLASGLAAVLKRNGLSTRDIELEITESCLMGDDNGELTMVRRLADMGFRIAIDDFGTGFSSLSRLQEMPVHKLKIDRAFVAPLPGRGKEGVMAETILSLARRMNLKTVAEGVETEAQRDWLKKAGCGLMQGFYFAKPMPLSEFIDWAWAHRSAGKNQPAWAHTAPMEDFID